MKRTVESFKLLPVCLCGSLYQHGLYNHCCAAAAADL